MEIRSDWTLQRQLEGLQREAAHADSRSAIKAVLDHMSSGRMPYRGAYELARLLTVARAIAADVDDWQCVAGVHSALAYAEGRILRPDFESKYDPSGSGERSELDRESTSDMLSGIAENTAHDARVFLEDHPDCTAEDVIEYLEQMAADSRLLDEPEDRPGRYRVLRGRSELLTWALHVLSERVDVEDLDDAVRRIVTSPKALEVLAADRDGKTLFAAAGLQRRSGELKELREIAEDRSASENDLQKALQGRHWIFGGRIANESTRRRLVRGDEVDIPLIAFDGALRIVELKRSMSLKHGLVTHQRNALILTNDVHRAVAQVMNYLVGLDENREKILEQYGIDTRRASGLVLIGHPDLHPEVPEEEIDEAIRIFNSHLTRVEVRTYKDLIDSAERTLRIVEPE